MRSLQKLEKLEAVRGLAAFYVLVHHWVHSRNELAALQKFFVFGQAAVLVFFLLSGFVIYYAMMKRDPEMGWGRFVWGRFKRIFPIYILALLTNYGLRCLGTGTLADFPWQDFLLNVAQLQDDNHPYSIVHPFLLNHPLWSLSYEWWFYMLFWPLQHYLRSQPQIQKWVVLGFCASQVFLFTFLPNGMSMFFAYWVIWWAGVEMAREFMETGKVTLQRQWIPWGMIAVVGLLWFLPTQVGEMAGRMRNWGEYPYLQIRHFASVGVIIVAGFVWYKLKFIGYAYSLRVFRLVAPISYALYIVHLPFIHVSSALTTGNIYTDMLVYIPIILGYAWLLEVVLHPRISKLLG